MFKLDEYFLLFFEAALAAGSGDTCPVPPEKEADVPKSWPAVSLSRAPETGLQLWGAHEC